MSCLLNKEGDHFKSTILPATAFAMVPGRVPVSHLLPVPDRVNVVCLHIALAGM